MLHREVKHALEQVMQSDDALALRNVCDNELDFTETSLLAAAVRFNAPKCLQYLLTRPPVGERTTNTGPPSGGTGLPHTILTVAAKCNPRMIPVLLQHGRVHRDSQSENYQDELHLLTCNLFDNENEAHYDYVNLFKLLVESGAKLDSDPKNLIPVVDIFRHGVEQHLKNILHFPDKYPLGSNDRQSRRSRLIYALKGNDVHECLAYVAALSSKQSLALSLRLTLKTLCRFSGLCEYVPYAPTTCRATKMFDVMVPIMRYLHDIACILVENITVPRDACLSFEGGHSPPSIIIETLHGIHFSSTFHTERESLRDMHVRCVNMIVHTMRRLTIYPCFQTRTDNVNIVGLLSQHYELYFPFLAVVLYSLTAHDAAKTLKDLVHLCEVLNEEECRTDIKSRLHNVKLRLLEKLSEFYSLKNITRMTIMNNVRIERYLHDVYTLPLPGVLKQYLLS